MTYYGPIQAGPLVEGLKTFISQTTIGGTTLPCEYGHLPVDTSGRSLPVPYVVIDSVSPEYNGPPFGDLHGQADWKISGRTIANRADQVAEWQDAVMRRLFDRFEDKRYAHEIEVAGQYVTNREPDPASYGLAPSGDGIVALVLRFTVRTQRA